MSGTCIFLRLEDVATGKAGAINKIVIAAAISTCLLMAGGCREKTEAPPPPPGVIVVPAKIDAVTPSAAVIGQVKALNNVKLVARVKGFLEQQNFSEGAVVKKGTLLFLIEQSQYKAAVKSTEAALLKAQADQRNALNDYDRQKKLYTQSAVSQKTYEDALCRKMETDSAILRAQADLDVAKVNLSYTEILAPFDGRIGLVNYTVGNFVGPESMMLTDIVQLDPVRVQFNVSEVDLLKVMKYQEQYGSGPGLAVKIVFQDGTQYEHTGSITFWNNQVNPTTGTMLLQTTIANPKDILLPGMYVRVILEVKTARKALVIPLKAVMEDQTGQYVMAVGKNNIVESRRIETGLEVGLNVVVKSGLAEGEKVIVDGIQKVRPGVAVLAKVDELGAWATPVISAQHRKQSLEELVSPRSQTVPPSQNEFSGKAAATEKGRVQ